MRSGLALAGGGVPFNPPFENDDRGRRSIALDLADETRRAIALELVDAADVLVTNVRSAGLECIGFDYESLRQRNPGLIYGAISPGFAAPVHGPHTDEVPASPGRDAEAIARLRGRGAVA